MNSLHYSIENPTEKRKLLLETNLQVLELLNQQEPMDKLKTKKEAQIRKLKTQIISIKKGVTEFIDHLPDHEHHEQTEEKKVITKKEVITKELSNFEKEIAELREKIKNL